LSRDKANLQYIRGGNPHLTSQLCKDELGLNSLPNMVSRAKYWSAMVSSSSLPSASLFFPNSIAEKLYDANYFHQKQVEPVISHINFIDLL